MGGYYAFNVPASPSPAGRAKGGLVSLITVKFGSLKAHLFMPKQQFYLSFTTNIQTRFSLTRFRLGTLHFLVAFPRQSGWMDNLTPCPCDNMVTQSTLHFILFCALYKEPRRRFLVPLLNNIHPCTYVEGFRYLQSLTSSVICSAVSNFIKTAMAIGKHYESQ